MVLGQIVNIKPCALAALYCCSGNLLQPHKIIIIILIFIISQHFCLDNDLDGKALAIAIGQGPESLKEAIPSLSKRLKVIGAIQVLQASLMSSTDMNLVRHYISQMCNN